MRHMYTVRTLVLVHAMRLASRCQSSPQILSWSDESKRARHVTPILTARHLSWIRERKEETCDRNVAKKKMQNGKFRKNKFCSLKRSLSVRLFHSFIRNPRSLAPTHTIARVLQSFPRHIPPFFFLFSSFLFFHLNIVLRLNTYLFNAGRKWKLAKYDSNFKEPM